MNFSLLLASRERLGLLTGLLDSLIKNTANPELIEVLVGIDSDDRSYDINLLEKKYSRINLRFFVRSRSPAMHRDYINFLAKQARGKYLFVLNDDTIFDGKDWDIHGLSALENYLRDKPDGVVYGFTETDGGSALCTFPLVSRKAAEVLGWVMPQEILSWGGDHYLNQFYSRVGRKLLLPQIPISHISIHSKSRPRDEISYEIERNFMTNHNIYIPTDYYLCKLTN